MSTKEYLKYAIGDNILYECECVQVFVFDERKGIL